MTNIEQAIKEAVEEGGYDDTDMYHDGNWRIHDAAKIFHDPAFWQALGKARGWNKEFRVGDRVITPHGEGSVTSVENIKGGRTRVRFSEGGLSYYPTFDVQPTRANGKWRKEWHRFIDHLADGKDAEAFFATLV